MYFSAVASSSAVVTPGRAFAASILMQREWIRPAAAIFSSCSGLFLTIIRYTRVRLGSPRLGVLLHPQGREQPLDVAGDLVRRAGAVEAPQEPGLLVMADQRLGFVVVGLEALADHLGLVVVADVELRPVDVALALLLRRVELDVEDVALLAAGAAPAQPPHDLLVGDVEQDHCGQLTAGLADRLVERLA